MDQQHLETALALARQISSRYEQVFQVEAVVLGGSYATGLAEPASDIDLYVYSHTAIPLTDREVIAKESSSALEFNNQFWETGDEWTDRSTGIHVDVMFRHTKWIKEQLDQVLVRHEASLGYSTCLWHNVQTSTLLFDKNGWFTALQEKARQSYPDALQQAILSKNYPLLRKASSAYRSQLKKAISRADVVSINHRLTAFLASYFDIIFAINRLPHPGEKRLIDIVEKTCRLVPHGMRKMLHQILKAPMHKDLLPFIDALIDELDTLLRNEGLLLGDTSI